MHRQSRGNLSWDAGEKKSRASQPTAAASNQPHVSAALHSSLRWSIRECLSPRHLLFRFERQPARLLPSTNPPCCNNPLHDDDPCSVPLRRLALLIWLFETRSFSEHQRPHRFPYPLAWPTCRSFEPTSTLPPLEYTHDTLLWSPATPPSIAPRSDHRHRHPGLSSRNLDIVHRDTARRLSQRRGLVLPYGFTATSPGKQEKETLRLTSSTVELYASATGLK